MQTSRFADARAAILFLCLTAFGAEGRSFGGWDLQYTAGWFGNSLNNVTPYLRNGNVPDFSYEYVQKDGNALAVSADGTCYVTSGWDETGRGLGFYKNGHNAGQAAGVSALGAAVAVDDKYVYTCVQMKTMYGQPKLWTVARWNLDGSPATVPIPPVIHGYAGGMLASGGEVFVADPGADVVLGVDRTTFLVQQRIPVHAPWRMTLDAQGKLWVINRSKDDPNKGSWYSAEDPTSTAQVTQYDLETGKPTGKNIPNMTNATAVAVTPDNTLLVAGPNSQVLEFDISGVQPKQVGMLGVKGGVYSDPDGTMGPDRLLGLWGVGCDKAGNIYTLGRLPDADTGIDLRSFTRDGKKMNWHLYNVAFTAVGGPDPASDGLDVYTPATHFRLDPDKPPGQQATWVGYTLDPFHYDDARSTQGDGDSPMMRRLQGRLYMYLHPGVYFTWFRKGPAEAFIPSGMLDLASGWMFNTTTGDHAHDLDWPPQQPWLPGPPPHPWDKYGGPPVKTRWAWRDENGDGKIQKSEIRQVAPQHVNEFAFITDSWVDNKGDIWLVGDHAKIWHLPMQGFDAHQNPIYDWDKEIFPKVPADLQEISRIQYDSDNDVMYLSGTPPDFKGREFWGAFGTQIVCYDHWNTNPTVRWKIKVPPSNGDEELPAFSVAGDRVFCMQRFTSRIWVFSNTDAKFMGMIEPTDKTGSSGWCDQPNGIQAMQRKDGSYVVFAEDDYRPKIRFYQVPVQPPLSPAPEEPQPLPPPKATP